MKLAMQKSDGLTKKYKFEAKKSFASIRVCKLGVLCIIILASIMLAVSGCSESRADRVSDEIWLTVGDRVIYGTEAKHFLVSSARFMTTHLPLVGWNDVIDGMPTTEYIKFEALNSMRIHYAVHMKAQEMSIGLTAQQQEMIENLWDSRVAEFGGEEAFIRHLEAEGSSAELFKYLIETSFLNTNILDALFGENGSMRATEQQLIAFAQEQGAQVPPFDPENAREAHAQSEFRSVLMQWREEVSYELKSPWNTIDVRELYERAQ